MKLARPSPWTLSAFVLYAVIASLFGDFFPFSQYSMYAGIDGRRQAAVPVALADGKPADLRDYVDFAGLTPEKMFPAGYACSMEWKIDEAKSWIGGRRAAAGREPGPVRIEWGFRLISVDDAGRISERIQIVDSGTAWPSR